jgi:hypothetical protein
MPNVKITVDRKSVERLGAQIGEAEEVGLRRVLERGEQILREEIPKATHNLAQGVSSDRNPRSKTGALSGFLIVSARRARLGAREATVHLSGGKTKAVSLRAHNAFDYAEAVARGTGIYGPQGTEIVPRQGKALLIPVSSPATLNGKTETYIEIDGQVFVLRKSMKGMKPNPYDERTAKRLEPEAQRIMDKALESFDQVNP